MRRALRVGLWAVAGGAALAAGTFLVWLAPYPEPDFDALKGSLQAVEPPDPVAAPMGAADHILRSSSGLAIRVRVRLPPDGGGPVPAAIVLGGLQRGKGAADLAAQVVGDAPIVLASLDYLYGADPDPRGWAIVGAAREARPALYHTVAGTRLLIDFLARHPRVRPDRIVLVGVSLGGPVAVAVAGMDSRLAAVACLFGADLPNMLGHAVRPRVGPLAGALVPLVAWHLRPIDPARHVSAIAPRPFLLVGGRGDRRIPAAAIEALARAAGPAARTVWLEAPHPDPAASEWLRLAAAVVRSWLAEHGLLDTAAGDR